MAKIVCASTQVKVYIYIVPCFVVDGNGSSSGKHILFGDIGGGIALNNEWDWIHETTGLAIPEPSSALLLMFGSASLFFYRRSMHHRQYQHFTRQR